MKEKGIVQMNWAWVYKDGENGAWVQFGCMECLILEFHYQIWKIGEKAEYNTVDIIDGVIDFEQKTFKKSQDLSESVQIKRTDDNRK